MLKNRATKAIKFLVGNKSDLKDDRIVSYDEAKKWAETYSMEYIETSASEYDNIDNLFMSLTKEIIKDSKESNKETSVNIDK